MTEQGPEQEPEQELWQPLLDRTVSAFADGDLAGGRMACDLLLSWPNLPNRVRANARCNSVFYAPILRDTLPGFQSWTLSVELPNGWFPFNPSIVEDGEGYLASVRCSNYAMPGWVIAPGDDRYRTHVALVPLDRRGMQTGPARLLRDTTVDDAELDDRNVGVEDLRLFWHDGRLRGIGSVVRRIGPLRQRVITIGLFDIDRERGVIERPRWLSDERGNLVEKNWMPVNGANGVRLVYGCGPTTVVDADDDTGELTLTACHATLPAAGGYRGGTPLLPDGDGWIALVHEAADWENGLRTYLHRIVRFGPDLTMTEVSHPFRFHGEEIEFAAGLARRGEDLLVGFGVGDCKAWIAAMPAAALTGLLRPVREFMPAGLAGGEIPQGVARLLRPAAAAPEGWPATWQEMLAAPTFVINLDRTPDRLGSAMERIQTAGYQDVRRVRAVDGQLPDELAHAWAALGNPPFLKDRQDFVNQLGHQGCFLSHVSVWQRIVDEDIPWATIFEDDVLFHSEWETLAQAFYRVTPPETSVVWLGCSTPSLVLPATPILRIPVFGTYAVMVSNAGARRLLHIALGNERGVTIIDQAMFAAQSAELAAESTDGWWAVWNGVDFPDPEYPTVTRNGVVINFGLVHADRRVASTTEPIGAWPALFRTVIDAATRLDRPTGRLACDRLLAHPETPKEVLGLATQEQLAFVDPLTDIAAGARMTRLPIPSVGAAPVLAKLAGGVVALAESSGQMIALPIDSGHFSLGQEVVAPGLSVLAAMTGLLLSSDEGRS
ncbi:MAG: glycosyltransferase family 25 protein, partial [Thermomicrobiales bacterium]